MWPVSPILDEYLCPLRPSFVPSRIPVQGAVLIHPRDTGLKV